MTARNLPYTLSNSEQRRTRSYLGCVILHRVTHCNCKGASVRMPWLCLEPIQLCVGLGPLKLVRQRRYSGRGEVSVDLT
jgi:hypothetical protein